MNFLISREQKLEEFLSVTGKKERRKFASREETVKIFRKRLKQPPGRSSYCLCVTWGVRIFISKGIFCFLLLQSSPLPSSLIVCSLLSRVSPPLILLLTRILLTVSPACPIQFISRTHPPTSQPLSWCGHRPNYKQTEKKKSKFHKTTREFTMKGGIYIYMEPTDSCG